MHQTKTPSGDGFVPRPWLDERIARWLATDEPLLVLVGGPGSGKTAFAGHVAASRPELVYHHACRFDVDRTLDPRRLIEALVGRLSRRVDGFGQALLESTRSPAIEINQEVGNNRGTVIGAHVDVAVGSLPARPVFDELVRRPLEGLATDGAPLLLVVDALDESLSYDAGGGIVQLLTAVTREPSLRWLVTSRREPRVLDRLDRTRIDLRDDGQSAQDIRRYLAQRVWSGGLRDRIADRADGDYLYARHVADQVEAQGDATDELALPGDLTAAYAEFVKRELASDAHWEDRYRPRRCQTTQHLQRPSFRIRPAWRSYRAGTSSWRISVRLAATAA